MIFLTSFTESPRRLISTCGLSLGRLSALLAPRPLKLFRIYWRNPFYFTPSRFLPHPLFPSQQPPTFVNIPVARSPIVRDRCNVCISSSSDSSIPNKKEKYRQNAVRDHFPAGRLLRRSRSRAIPDRIHHPTICCPGGRALHAQVGWRSARRKSPNAPAHNDSKPADPNALSYP